MKKNRFGKGYFDSDKSIPGAYQSYEFQDRYPRYETLSLLIRKHINPERTLDVGCAKGFLVYALRQIGIEAFGVDISNYAISQAALGVRPYLHEVDMNRDSLPFEDDYFGFVSLLGSIEYLHNHRHAVKEIERVMIAGGSLLITTIYRKPGNDVYRVNVHDRNYWRKEFKDHWKTSKAYSGFLSECLRNFANSAFFSDPTSARYSYYPVNLLNRFGHFGRTALTVLWNILTSVNVIGFGILLYELRK